MLLRKSKDNLPGRDIAQQHLIIARAGVESIPLPVSTACCLAPDSPTQASALSSIPSASSSPSASSGGHLVAGRNSFEDVALTDGKSAAGNFDGAGLLNRKLSSLLEKRKAKEAEAIKSLIVAHANEILHKEALHNDELNMKDTAHRRIVDHIEGELVELRQQLEAALNRWEASVEQGEQLRQELEVERKLRRAAEEEQKSLHRLLESELEDV